MPLLNIVGSICTNKTFYVSFCFMADETEESYRWALTQLYGLFSPDHVPEVMVMDRDLALLNAVNEVFPWCHHQLCT
jgi:MULE transposase domain